MSPFFSIIALLHSPLVLGFARLVAADYSIDNSHRTVGYSATGTEWRTFSSSTQNLTLVLSNGSVTVDSSKCYNKNYALAACTVENKCQITIPFTGSGIKVYVMQAGFQGVTASLAIDGGQAVTATLQPPTPPSYQTPRVSLFDIQSLPSSNYTATVNVLDWDNGATSLYFDYARINESFVELPTSPSASAGSQPTSSATSISDTSSSATSPSTTQSTSASISASFIGTSPFNGSTVASGATSAPFTSTSRASLNLGAMVGGACGGLAVVTAIIASILLLKKSLSRRAKLEESRQPDPFPVSAAPAPAGDGVLPPLPVYLPHDEKTRQRRMARNAVVYYSHRQADSESSDFHIHPTAGDAERTPNVVTGWKLESLPRDDFIIDDSPEHGSVIDIHGSGVQDTPPSTVVIDSVPPPHYQSLNSGGTNNPSTPF